MLSFRLLVVVLFLACVTTKTNLDGVDAAIVVNNVTRLDGRGLPLNAHQGSMIRGSGRFAGRYYLYGDWFRACKPQGFGCRCVGDPPGMKVDGIGIYSTADFVSWKQEGGGGQLFNGFNQPRVAYFPSTQKYHMYMQFPLRVATSVNPAGPFTLEPGVIALDSVGGDYHGSGDMNVFVDTAAGRNGTGYIIFTSGYKPPVSYTPKSTSTATVSACTSHVPIILCMNVVGTVSCRRQADGHIRIQQLAADGRSAVPGKVSEPFPPHPCEAPLMFRRGAVYYALFGHNCPCCSEGSELFVFTAPHPLGPWTGGNDVNVDSSGKRVVKGQSAFVVAIGDEEPTQPKSRQLGGSQSEADVYMWATDEWGSGQTRAGNFQYWAPLSFAKNGSVEQLEYQQSWVLELDPGSMAHGPGVTVHEEAALLERRDLVQLAVSV